MKEESQKLEVDVLKVARYGSNLIIGDWRLHLRTEEWFHRHKKKSWMGLWDERWSVAGTDGECITCDVCVPQEIRMLAMLQRIGLEVDEDFYRLVGRNPVTGY